jgi:hypothetical protein
LPTNRDDDALKKLEKLGKQLDVAKAASKETLKVVEKAKETTEQAKRDLKLHENPPTKRKRKRKPADR